MSTRFTFEELRATTENFAKILGKCGFGTVFEGRWADERIAVKCLDNIRHGKNDFLAEVETIDEKFNAKVADCGLSKLIDMDISRVMTKMRGTPGYLAPEWLTAMVTEKVDVYSFGVVVMEIISGRRNLDDSQTEENCHLIKLLEEKSKSNGLSDLIDKNLGDIELYKNEIVKVMELAMWCLQWDSN
ncbi:G-type lectin S-receptor-like serine/threonine-protein kinase SD2-5 [Carex rostrata]